MSITYLKSFLEKIDRRRDKLLFPLIKSYWPHCITPNYLTALRIVIGITLCFLLLSGFKIKAFIVPFFVLAILSDTFDGSVARALNKKTKTGAFLDPLADKILIIPIAIYSLVKHYKVLLLFLILPEVISLSRIIYYKMQYQITEANVNIFAKTKTTLEYIGFGIILLNLPLSPSNVPVIFSLPKISVILLFLAVAFALFGLLFPWLKIIKNL